MLPFFYFTTKYIHAYQTVSTLENVFLVNDNSNNAINMLFYSLMNNISILIECSILVGNFVHMIFVNLIVYQGVSDTHTHTHNQNEITVSLFDLLSQIVGYIHTLGPHFPFIDLIGNEKKKKRKKKPSWSEISDDYVFLKSKSSRWS